MEFEHNMLMGSDSFDLGINRDTPAKIWKAWERMPFFNSLGWERSSRVYKRLGVHLFKRFNPITGDRSVLGRFIAPPSEGPQVDRTPQSLSEVRSFTIANETLHFLVLLVYGGVTIADIHAGNNGSVITDILGNFAINAYPILQQRYTRARLDRILHRPSRSLIS